MNGNESVVGNNPSANNVWIGDQFTEIIDFYLIIPDNVGSLLASDVSKDATVIPLTSGHGSSTGDCICLSEGYRFSQAEILSFSGDDATIDTPLDCNYTAANAEVTLGKKNLNADGSSSTVIAKISPPSLAVWDVTRLVIHMEDNTDMDSSRFAGIAALTNGVVLRHLNSITNNIFNVKSNGEFGERAYDIEFDPRAPAGEYGFRCRRSFGGQSKNGVVIRLDGSKSPKEEIQLLTRDNLTAVSKIRFIIQGHVTTSQGGL